MRGDRLRRSSSRIPGGAATGPMDMVTTLPDDIVGEKTPRASALAGVRE